MINVGIIGCGFVGGALKDWLEHNNPECKLFISDPAKGYNDLMADIDIAFLQIHVPTEDDGTQDLFKTELDEKLYYEVDANSDIHTRLMYFDLKSYK